MFDQYASVAAAVAGALGEFVGTAVATVPLLAAASAGTFEVGTFADLASLAGLAGLAPLDSLALG